MLLFDSKEVISFLKGKGVSPEIALNNPNMKRIDPGLYAVNFVGCGYSKLTKVGNPNASLEEVFNGSDAMLVIYEDGNAILGKQRPEVFNEATPKKKPEYIIK